MDGKQNQEKQPEVKVENQTPIEEKKEKQEDKVIEVGNKIKDGQYVCPNCGSSQIEPNPKTGKLKCAYCACEFEGKQVENTVKDLSKLRLNV